MASLRSEIKGRALVITLDRPPRNVLDLATIRELRTVVAELGERRDLRALVFRSALPGVFSAGVDVADHRAARAKEMLASFHGVFRLLDRLPQVTIAAVDGVCLGGAAELAFFCDIVLATEASSFGQPEIDLGCFPPVAAALLPRLAGRVAFDLVLSGRRLSAPEALAAGLLTRVVDDLPGEAARWLSLLDSKSGFVLAAARRALRAATRPDFEEALAASERVYHDEVIPSADAEEGIDAFFDKRAPRWTDS